MSVSGGGSPDSNSLLQGNYTYIMSGSTIGQSNRFYKRAGTFVADGKGRITSGVDDYMQGSQPVTTQFSGSYRVEPNGTGLLALTINGTQLQWAFTITGNSNLDLIEFDSLATGAGGARLQSPSQMVNALTGKFVFSMRSFQPDLAVQGSVSRVGRITIGSGGVVNGAADVVRAGSFSSVNFSGSLTSPDSNGKGVLSFTDTQGFTVSYFYYVIDGNTLNLLETDLSLSGSPNLGIGRAEAQTGGPFTNSSLNNAFVFSSSGDTPLSLFGVVTVGVFTSTGDGNIVNGSFDSVPDGAPISNVDITGTYDVNSAGRAMITLNPSGASGLSPISQVAWMVSPSKAFFLVNDSGRDETGTLYQQSTPITNTSVKGTFAFTMFGHDTQSPSEVERVGIAIFDGSALTLKNYFVERGGSKTETSAPGAVYNIGPNGRMTASINGISANVVAYMISNNLGYFILEDPNTEIAGSFAQGVSP